ncbi:MAG: Unknown protein [uncultured Aureispira sp.]|uniref:Uncharacterized protein n=1 Tax=uncultured Aureispira sp. TaxID=1331704 RepID=A0A6S6S862_9BACT|nr:MAG: Unknown protein [uncultured Aureispira sp.]
MQIQGYLIILFISLITGGLNAQKVAFTLEDLEVVVQTATNSILLGEEYTAEIFFNQKIPATYGIEISVRGAQLMVKNQKANYTTKGIRIGQKKEVITVALKNGKGKLIRSFKKEISYKVSISSINVSLDKMNVFYVGVENPITVFSADIFANSLMVEISGKGAKLRKTGPTSYVVTCEQSGLVTLTVTDKETGKKHPTRYRVKKIPEPIVSLGKLAEGEITVATFLQQPGLAAWLYNFDFQARCTIKQYKVLHYTKKNEMVEFLNIGARFEEKTLAEIKKAQPGDLYMFTAVEGDCPKDAASRHFNSLVFKIK